MLCSSCRHNRHLLTKWGEKFESLFCLFFVIIWVRLDTERKQSDSCNGYKHFGHFESNGDSAGKLKHCGAANNYFAYYY